MSTKKVLIVSAALMSSSTRTHPKRTGTSTPWLCLEEKRHGSAGIDGGQLDQRNAKDMDDGRSKTVLQPMDYDQPGAAHGTAR
jgi:hypothetical protein